MNYQFRNLPEGFECSVLIVDLHFYQTFNPGIVISSSTKLVSCANSCRKPLPLRTDKDFVVGYRQYKHLFQFPYLCRLEAYSITLIAPNQFFVCKLRRRQVDSKSPPPPCLFCCSRLNNRLT